MELSLGAGLRLRHHQDGQASRRNQQDQQATQHGAHPRRSFLGGDPWIPDTHSPRQALGRFHSPGAAQAERTKIIQQMQRIALAFTDGTQLPHRGLRASAALLPSSPGRISDKYVGAKQARKRYFIFKTINNII
jgi:hypothetical protein